MTQPHIGTDNPRARLEVLPFTRASPGAVRDAQPGCAGSG